MHSFLLFSINTKFNHPFQTWLTMGACVVATVIFFGLFAMVMKSFGIELL
jgi:hypothetical protein